MKYSNIAIILTAMMIVSFSMESCTKNTNEADVVVNTSTKDTWTILRIIYSLLLVQQAVAMRLPAMLPMLSITCC